MKHCAICIKWHVVFAPKQLNEPGTPLRLTFPIAVVAATSEKAEELARKQINPQEIGEYQIRDIHQDTGPGCEGCEIFRL